MRKILTAPVQAEHEKMFAACLALEAIEACKRQLAPSVTMGYDKQPKVAAIHGLDVLVTQRFAFRYEH